MSREEIRENNTYYTLIQGSFRVQVSPDHPQAVRRDYETSDGKTGTKYERIVNSLIGFIEDVQFRDSDYGKQIYIMLDENESGEKPVVSLNTDSREAQDFMKKLPNVNLLKEVRLRPYSFIGESGDTVKGLDLSQEDSKGEFTVKVPNYFFDSEKKTNLHGFPAPENREDMTKDDWKIFFLQVKKFLIAFTLDTMCAKVAQAVIDRGVASPKSAEQEARIRSNEEATEGINIDDVPF